MVLLSRGLHGDAESSGLARAAITMNGVSNLRIKDYKYPKIQLFLSSSCVRRRRLTHWRVLPMVTF